MGYVSITALKVSPRFMRLIRSAMGTNRSVCGTRYAIATEIASSPAPGNRIRASG